MFGFLPTTRTTPTRRDRDDDDEEEDRRPPPALRPHYQPEQVAHVWVDALLDELGAERKIERYCRIRSLNRNYSVHRPVAFDRVVRRSSVKKNINDSLDEFDCSHEHNDDAPHRCVCGQTTWTYYIVTNRFTANRLLIGSCCIEHFEEELNEYTEDGFVVNDGDIESSDYEPSDYEN